MRADVHRFSLADPSDVSGLKAAFDSGLVDPTRIVAVIGKTHGNGLVNDYTRGYLTLCLSTLIGQRLGESAHVVRARVPFVFSGGVEGVLSPHYSVFTVSPPTGAPSPEKALAVGVTFTERMRPSDIGRNAQINAVAAAVRQAVADAKIENVHFVQVKGPAFTLAEILEDRCAGPPSASDDPGKLMAYGRAASALAVAKALGEIPSEHAVDEAVLSDFSLCSAVASISAGIEVRTNEVIVVGMSSAWTGNLVIDHGPMVDALDVGGVHAVVRRLGFPDAPQIADPHRIRAVFVKCEPQRDGKIRGRIHNMLNDGDIDAQRHIRGAVGGMVAGALGETEIFVSGGAEHQGPPGGGLIALIAEKPAMEV
jgi:cyanuric acid amidohydrolase